MVFWVVRGGRHGIIEHDMLEKNTVAIGWGKLPDLSRVQSKEHLRELYASHYSTETKLSMANRVGQIWNFVHNIKKGDLVAMPLKSRPLVAIGEIVGDYWYVVGGPEHTYHQRPVMWKKEIPRSDFAQDIRFSLGSLLTVGRVRATDAERRVRDMLDGKGTTGPIDEGPDESEVDLEELANDRILKFLEQKFAGHELARLVDAILVAKGYVTHLSPPGPDGGVDILAASGSLGFDDPKICVQVKSSHSPVGSDILNQLNGVIQKFGANHGILVAWGGLTRQAEREITSAFFRTRLWDQKTIVDELVANYDKLDDEIKSEIPLQRIWTVIEPE